MMMDVEKPAERQPDHEQGSHPPHLLRVASGAETVEPFLTELNDIAVSKEKVFELQVTMGDALAVDVAHGLARLPRPLRNPRESHLL